MFWLKNLYGWALINADRFSIALVTFGWCQSLAAWFQMDSPVRSFSETSRHEVTKHVVSKLMLMTYEKTLNLVYQTNDCSTNLYY